MCHEGRRVVRVGYGERAARRHRRIGLGERRARRADHRRVVGTVDGDLHRARRAIGRRDCEGLGDRLADVQAVEALLAAYVHAPLAAIEKRAVGAGDCSSAPRRPLRLSTSDTVSIPAVPAAHSSPPASLAARLTTAASLVPLIVILTVLVAPSAVLTVNVSVTTARRSSRHRHCSPYRSTRRWRRSRRYRRCRRAALRITVAGSSASASLSVPPR